MATILKNRYDVNSTAYRPITTKFGRQMQNDMRMTIYRSKLKPEIEFQYSSHLFYFLVQNFCLIIDRSTLYATGVAHVQGVELCRIRGHSHFRSRSHHSVRHCQKPSAVCKLHGSSSTEPELLAIEIFTLWE